MGFFSRLFQPRADGLAAPEDWTSLPASEASALVLYDEEASRHLAAFDIEAAIVMHERWRARATNSCAPKRWWTTPVPSWAAGCTAAGAWRWGTFLLSTC